MKLNVQYIFLLLFLASCSKTSMPDTLNGIVFSTPQFTTSVVDVKSSSIDGGAFLYDSESFLDKSRNGGYFLVEAYKSGENTKHFTSPTTVMYHTDVAEGVLPSWKIYNPHTNSFESRYWPQTYNLDFLAYMPVVVPAQNSDEETAIDTGSHISLGDYDTQNNSPTLKCDNLPLDKAGQLASKEFIYAWSANQSESTTNNEGKVTLEFKHPLSAIYVKIDGAHGGTVINSFGFNNIYNNGVYIVNSVNEKWNLSGSKGNLSIENVNDNIPDNIQMGHIYGPFLVLPQDLDRVGDDDVEITINYTWRGANESPSKALAGKWDAGKKYTYSLVLGDSMEDIIVNVSVEAWEPGGDNQLIEVK